YLLLMNMCKDRRAALMGAFFITLFGTFLYTTASGWKESLGIVLYFLLIYAYTRRNLVPMKIMLILLLMTLPFVHHLVALVSYMTVLFLTGWSVVFAAAYRTTGRRHFEDISIVALFSVFALGYYFYVSFDKLSYIGSATGFLLLLGTMALFFLGVTIMLLLPTHLKWTLAPIPAAFIMVLAYVDYSGHAFDYTPGTSAFNYYLIAAASAVMLFFGWYGLESMIESKSAFRAIPVAMLVPALTLMCFALISPTVDNKHQMIYRTFDMADPAIALGLGIAFYSMFRMRRLKRFAPVVLASTVALLMATAPYGLYTEEFTGVRHDTQAYEVEAFAWLKESHFNDTPYALSDERLSFIALMMFDYAKDNDLPQRLLYNRSLVPGDYNVYEKSWTTRGVNDYPNGLVQIDPEFMDSLMYIENVFYVGGPEEDQLIIIQHTWVGHVYNNWYYEDS
ncbi:MAG: hypothetical protein A3K76_06545, partial [Euryarchaeota archaeon RBG_13_57_23]